jgi:hypothetical protein
MSPSSFRHTQIVVGESSLHVVEAGDPSAAPILYLWHFAMHAIPALPELLTKGRQGPYFDYFFDTI